MKFIAILSLAATALASGHIVIREAVSPKAGIYISRDSQSISNQDCPQRIPHVVGAPGAGVVGVFGNRYWGNETYFSEDGVSLFYVDTASDQKQIRDGHDGTVLGQCTESFGSPEMCNDSTMGSKASSRIWYSCNVTTN
jgi:hypothetical protein